MNLLQQKLDGLCQKYAVPAKGTLSADASLVTVCGKEYPLFSHRSERRYIELRNIVLNTVGNISHFKTMSINPKDLPMEKLIAQELDVAEYISGQTISEVFAIVDADTASLLCRGNGGAVFTFELAATLPVGAAVIDKHEIITDRGTACDRAVDSQTPLYSVYVYGEENREYTDVDFELYGLSVTEIAAVRQAFAVCRDEQLGEENVKTEKHLASLLSAVGKSAATCSNVKL